MAELLLRPWQRLALDKLATHTERDFLTVATPGAGKTTFALVAVNRELHARPGPTVIVAPTAHLKRQWAEAGASVGLHLDPDWVAGNDFAPDMHGIVTTYQQVALAAPDLVRRCYDGIIVLDEVHHAGDEMAWGTSVGEAFKLARRRISLSGTPFRSDTAAIPFVRYHFEEAVPDVEYGYGDALADGVVRPVYFPRIDGEMEWVAPDGNEYQASFADKLNHTLTAQRLRTALSPHGNWLPDVLGRAHETLTQIRQTHAEAGGLVICIDAEHAKAVAAILRHVTHSEPTVALSEDRDSSERIARFRESDSPWIVAVRMVSEGVDIPRLRVGVFATTTTTELFFRQAVGRLVRTTKETMGARAVMYLPDDPRLRAHAMGIAEPRRHVLRRKEDDEQPNVPDQIEDPLDGMLAGQAEQASLFEVLSAQVADSGEAVPEWLDIEPFPQADAQGFELIIDTPPTPAGIVPASPPAGIATKSRAVTKTTLRQRNSDLVRVLVRRTGHGPREINARLNSRIGLAKISDATAEQLMDRITAAQHWIDEL
ncbi:DEAD/DEAH box helicase [Stomatohabitans albus]|uniref:DEAD/DEAH box helicase n=1 Tax=Stomatohabitans albus TaxID=3110766 RepID=UPI00300C753D